MIAWLVCSALLGTAAATLPFGFQHELLVGEPFEGEPVGFAFLPDGRPLILERQGSVRLAAAGESRSEMILEIPGVQANGLERGLLGVAVDPDWPDRPYVFFHYTHVASVTRLTMYTASGDLTDAASTSLTLSNPYSLLDDIPDSAFIHNAGTIRFGPDKMLYVSLGDDMEACHAQDLTSYHGKILRLDVSTLPGPGSGPPPKAVLTPSDNPFPGPGEIARLVFAWGLRNPYRFTIDPVTGDLFLGSVGFNDYEEINHLPRGEGAGSNFGWPQYEGPARITRFGDCGIENEFTDPIHVIRHGQIPISVIGGPLIRRSAGPRSGFPPSYEGDYFYFEIYSGTLHRLRETGEGWDFAPPAPGQPNATTWASGLQGASDAQIGPGGALYFAVFAVPGAQPGLHRIQKSFVGAPFDAYRELSLRAFPNPTRSGATFHHEALSPGSLQLQVFDVAGRRVRRVEISPWSGPPSWSGTDDSGRRLPAGTYLVRLDAEGFRGQGRLTLLR